MYYFVSLTASLSPSCYDTIEKLFINAYNYILGINEVKRSRGEHEIPVSLKIYSGSYEKSLEMKVSLDKWVIYTDLETTLVRFYGLIENLVMNKVWRQGSKKILGEDKIPVTILRYGFLWDKAVIIDNESGSEIDPREISDSKRNIIFKKLLNRKAILRIPLRIPNTTCTAHILEYSDYAKNMFPWESIKMKLRIKGNKYYII